MFTFTVYSIIIDLGPQFLDEGDVGLVLDDIYNTRLLVCSSHHRRKNL